MDHKIPIKLNQYQFRNFNKDKLWHLFASFGCILWHKFVSPEQVENYSYGFVQFASPQQAQSAIKGTHILHFQFPNYKSIKQKNGESLK